MKELRLEHNMTQSQMGEVLGINATMVELIETGEMGARLSDLLALRDLFGVSIGFWLERTMKDRCENTSIYIASNLM